MTERDPRDTYESQDDADERYRRLIEQSGVGLFQTRVDGTIEWLNMAAARVVGFDTPEEFINSVTDIRTIYLDPGRRDELIALLERDGSVSNFEYEMKRRDGHQRWISITAKAVLDRDGELSGFEGMFSDVTEKKLLEAATRAMSSNLEPSAAVARFAAVLKKAVPFQQLSLLVVEGDHYRRVVSVSANNSEPLLTGERVSLTGHPVAEVVRTARPLVVQDTEAGEWSFDQIWRAAGVGSYAIFPLMDDSEVFATFNVGLAEKHGLTDEVRSLLDVHTSAVIQAVRNILLYERQSEVVARLEELGRLKNELWAGISHDLRNPVSVLVGVTDVLEARWGSTSEEMKLKLLRGMGKSARRLSQLLERDLDVALIDLGEMQYAIAPFDLVQAVREEVELFAQAETKRELVLALPDRPLLVLGDEERHSQVLNNLLSNAAKFSSETSTVTVSIESIEADAQVSVIDQGPGIDEAGRGQLFQRMSRLGSSKPGTGLGLFMSKSMIEAQNGRIWIESEPGQGSTFSYTLPLVR